MLVVDASVAVKFVILEAGSEQALALLAEGTPLAAPDWMLLETAHAIWKFHASGGLTRQTALRANDAMPNFFARLYPAADLLADAIRLSYEITHDVYDCCYLALAIREATRVVSADRKFCKAARQAGLEDHVRVFEWPGQRT